MRERDKRQEGPEVSSGEANLPGIEDEEIPNPGELAQKIVEEREPGGSSEEGAGLSEDT